MKKCDSRKGIYLLIHFRFKAGKPISNKNIIINSIIIKFKLQIKKKVLIDIDKIVQNVKMLEIHFFPGKNRALSEGRKKLYLYLIEIIN